MAHRPTRLVLALAAATALGACRGEPLPAPDPRGKDLVEGAVVAAVTTGEKTAGVRTYKVLHVDDYPEPIGYNLHLVAYDPKAPTFDEAAAQRKRGGMTVVMKHFEVRLIDFIGRDHRVIARELLTDEELKPYADARDHKVGGGR
jgi:hypothetical protein